MPQLIALRNPNPVADEAVKIDTDKHVLRGVSVIQKGPAKGHGFEVDDLLLEQVRDKINATPKGVRSRLTHPGLTACGGRDGIEVTLGRVRNATVDGDRVRGDLHLAGFAATTPQGDIRSYLEAIAQEDPELAGMSIVLEPSGFDVEQVDEARPESTTDADGNHIVRYARAESVLAADVVGDPAANTDGLLARLPAEIRGGITPELLERWAEDLRATATDDPTNHPARTEPPTMPKPTTPDKPTDPPANDPTPTDPPPAALTQADLDKAAKDARENALAEVQERNREIYALAKVQGLGEAWAFEQIEAGRSVEQAKDEALRRHAENRRPVNATIEVGDDLDLSTIGPALSDAILMRAGRTQWETEEIDGAERIRLDAAGRKIPKPPHDRAADFRHLTIIDMARQHFRALGVPNVDRLSRTRVVELMGPRAFRRAYPQVVSLAQSTDDFDAVLGDAQNKSLRNAYLDAPATWDIWARRTTAPDFKTIKRAALSEAGNLTARTEGGEIQYVTLTDSQETYTLAEYAGGIILTRQAVINDDLDAFSRIPQAQGSAARRKEDDVAYAIITANAALGATSVALFYATTHVNLASGSANVGAPSVAFLAAGESAMMIQKGPKSAAYLELVPRFLLVPTAHKATADQLINSTVDPTKSNATVNPYHGRLTVVASARLNANSTTAWYLFADYREGQVETIEVAFLEDEQMPVLKQETDFDTDDARYAVRHTCAAKALDFRGVYKNPGA